MFGDWGGERIRLEQMGITFYGEYRDDFQGNVTGTDKNGNERDHSVNFVIFYLNLDVDLMKLADIAGEFFFRAVWQYGGNLSDRYLNVHTSTSSIAGTNSERIDQLWYRAHALKKRTWGDLTALWVAHDVRDAIMDFIAHWSEHTEIRALQLVCWIGLSRSKFYSWRNRYGKANEHNALVPRVFLRKILAIR